MELLFSVPGLLILGLGIVIGIPIGALLGVGAYAYYHGEDDLFGR